MMNLVILNTSLPQQIFKQIIDLPFLVRIDSQEMFPMDAVICSDEPENFRRFLSVDLLSYDHVRHLPLT